MTRRQFIAASLAAAVASGRRASGQPSNRAAVVIGVDQTGTLPKLNAAASGAASVGDWLRREGFEVVPFVDSSGPVKAEPIFEAVSRLVDRGTLEQLVVYFSGHGTIVSSDELWLLSEAPVNANQAIKLRECVELSRETAIPNVVFISDACRSPANSLQAHRVGGQLIFPNQGTVGSRSNTEVDRFYAANPGSPAFELPVSEIAAAYEGIFTSTLLDAFANPDVDIVSSVGGVNVVTNRALKKYLQREVPKRAEAKSIRLWQQPDSRIESEAVYLGKAGAVRPPQHAAAVERRPTITDVAGIALQDVGVNPLGVSRGTVSAEAVSALASSSGFEGARGTILLASTRAGVPTQFETRTGVIVHGATVVRAATTPQIRAELLDRGDGAERVGVLRLDRKPGSAALWFTSGTGTVVACLPNFLAHVVVKDGGVIDVSYVPAETSHRWHDYQSQAQRINELRATVATSAKFGVFRIEGTTSESRSRADQLAGQIRVFKGIDPSLGLYAAYAYADAGFVEEVRSIDGIMRLDLGTSLYDVSMLAGSLSSSPSIVPFCPMLNQGWGFLRVRNAKLPGELSPAFDHRLASLWTTFDPEGMRSVETLVRSRSHAIAEVRGGTP
jgi:hypothetical protein